jgi:ferredoxin
MSIKKVSIIPGCISCGTCEVICKEVFTVKDISYVNESIDPALYENEVLEAADMCPVSVIKVEKEK